MGSAANRKNKKQNDGRREIELKINIKKLTKIKSADRL